MEHATICPSEHELVRFVRQLLPDGASDRIRDHLDVCDPCRMGIVAGLSTRHTEPALGLDADLASGLHLGHFELVRRLGAGGMGVVYEAFDHRLGRTVALKLVRGDHDVPLLDEARAMARIRHPAVLTVYEAGELDGSVYLTTELIPGTTLREHQRGRSRRELIALYVRAAEGLMAAHAHGLVHRDFKAENVLVEETPAGTRVLVADFGLATALAAGGDVARGSAPAGTPAYMSPEQIDGRSVDDRVDVFAFCVSLWEAIAGARPYPGSTIAELRAAMTVTPKLPRGVPKILLRGIAVDPDARPTLAEITRALAPRRRVVYAAALVPIAIVAFVAWPRAVAAPECADAPTPAQAMAGWRSPVTPPWVQARVAAMLAARDREVVSLQRVVCAADDADAKRAWVSCRHDHAIDEAELARALATRWPSYDGLDDALDLPWPSTCASRAARLDAILPPADAAKITLARARFAADAGQRWHVDPIIPLEAERLFDQAGYTKELASKDRVALLDAAVERAEREGHVTTAARAWLGLAIARADTNGDVDLALRQASWAIDRAGDPPMLRARWHEVSAAYAWQHTDLAGADAHAKAAAALAGDDPHRKTVALHALAAAAGARADFAAQRRLLEALLPTITTGAEATRTRMAYAECLYHLGELPLAHAQAELAIALAKQSAGERDPITAQALLTLGFVLLDEGKPEDCTHTIDRALEILGATVGPDHVIVGSALNLRSSARAAMHDFKGALADSEAAAALFSAKLGPHVEEVIFAHMQGGEQAKMLGDLAKARALLDSALADARATYGPEDPRTADAERSLASVSSPATARALLVHALAAHERAHTAAPYLAQVQAALAKLDGDRPLAETALAAWRGNPAWCDDYDELASWLRALDRHEIHGKAR